MVSYCCIESALWKLLLYEMGLWFLAAVILTVKTHFPIFVDVWKCYYYIFGSIGWKQWFPGCGVLFAQSCLTLCGPVDCSPPGSSVHGILQAGILEWVAYPFSRGFSWPRDWSWVSCIAGGFFTIWAIREVLAELHPISVSRMEVDYTTQGLAIRRAGEDSYFACNFGNILKGVLIVQD